MTRFYFATLVSKEGGVPEPVLFASSAPTYAQVYWHLINNVIGKVFFTLQFDIFPIDLVPLGSQSMATSSLRGWETLDCGATSIFGAVDLLFAHHVRIYINQISSYYTKIRFGFFAISAHPVNWNPGEARLADEGHLTLKILR